MRARVVEASGQNKGPIMHSSRSTWGYSATIE
uniref:Uncharacterized protein n=1 Tax=Rhizophora mucronata TaxID=61149 RepID=A0A2P2K1C2_RHIMU